MNPRIFDIPNRVKHNLRPGKIRHIESSFRENVDMSNDGQIGQVLAHNLRRAMERLEITQAEVAARGGLHPSQVSETLNFVSSPTIETAEKMARGVGMQLWELLVDNNAIRERAIRRYVLAYLSRCLTGTVPDYRRWIPPK
jgi:transcriptional regulator with XRE-family HTH domain